MSEPEHDISDCLGKCWGFPADDFWKCYCCSVHLDGDSEVVGYYGSHKGSAVSACGRCKLLTEEERSAMLKRWGKYDPFLPPQYFNPEAKLPTDAFIVDPREKRRSRYK